MFKLIIGVALSFQLVRGFRINRKCNKILFRLITFNYSSTLEFIRPIKFHATAQDQKIEDKYTAVPGLENAIRPSITDKARTITHICTSGTLCTTSVMDDVHGSPFGSYVDYILDDIGWPVLLLSDQSIHTQNIKSNPNVSLFCQLPRSHTMQSAAALSRVTIIGQIESVREEDLSPIRLAFPLVHQYAEQIIDSPKFSFYKIRPLKIYFSGGFGVMATWVDVEEYELARPDVLAQVCRQLLLII
jgi:hypothetical protein